MSCKYTCEDYRNEYRCQEALLKFETVVRIHNGRLRSNIEKQLKVADDLWVQIQRLLILRKSTMNVKPYPPEITKRMECETLYKIKNLLNEIHRSNLFLLTSFEALEETIETINNCLSAIDFNTRSPFIDGDTPETSLFRYIEDVRNVFFYLRNIHANFMFGAMQLSEDDALAVEVYIKVLKAKDSQTDYKSLPLCACKFIGNKKRTAVDLEK